MNRLKYVYGFIFLLLLSGCVTTRKGFTLYIPNEELFFYENHIDTTVLLCLSSLERNPIKLKKGLITPKDMNRSTDSITRGLKETLCRLDLINGSFVYKVAPNDKGFDLVYSQWKEIQYLHQRDMLIERCRQSAFFYMGSLSITPGVVSHLLLKEGGGQEDVFLLNMCNDTLRSVVAASSIYRMDMMLVGNFKSSYIKDDKGQFSYYKNPIPTDVLEIGFTRRFQQESKTNVVYFSLFNVESDGSIKVLYSKW